MRSALRIVLLSLAFALATSMAGWWAVPVLGAAWGWVASRTTRPALTAAVAAAAGWAGLLVWTALEGPVWELAGKVGGVLALPGWLLIIVTIGYAALLSGAAAWVVGAVRRAPAGER